MPRKTKLTKEDIVLIREAVKERERLREEAMLLSNEMLASKFGVSPTVISTLINGHYSYISAEEKNYANTN